MLAKDLQKFGFTKNESAVYLALFELGQAKAGQIIEKTGLHRNLVYIELKKLEDKKLIAKLSARGVAVYKALDPERFLDELKNKETLAQNIIEELRAAQHSSSQEIVVHEGLEGFRDHSMSVLRKLPEGGTLYVIGSVGDRWYELMGEQYPAYEKLRIKKKIHWKMIAYAPSDRDTKTKEEGKLCDIKIVANEFETPANITIFGDTVGLQTLTEPYSVTEIKNPALAKAYMNYFDALWNQDVEVTKGFEAYRQAYREIADALQPGEEYQVLGARFEALDPEGFGKEYPEILRDHHKRRQERGINVRLLFHPGSAKSLEENRKSYEKGAQIKVLSQQASSPTHIITYQDTSLLTVLDEKEPVVMKIRNQKMTDSFVGYFDSLWNQEVKTYAGWEEVERLYLENLLSLQDKDSVEYVMNAGYGSDEPEVRKKALELFVKYNRMRTKLGTNKKIVFFEKHRELAKREFARAGDDEHKLVKMKFLPNQYYSPMQVAIIANKAVITFFSKEPVATVYERPEIVASFKKQFDLQWSIGKE